MQDFIFLKHIHGITLATHFNMPPEQHGKQQIFPMAPIEASLDYPISKHPEKDKGRAD